MATAGFEELLVTAQVDGTAVTAAAATTLLPPASLYTLPANFLGTVGKQLCIEASGRISSVITTPGTARFDVRFGGTVVFDGLAILLDTVAAHVTVGWWLRIMLTVRAIGTTANLWGVGMWSSEDILGVPATAPKGVLTAMLPWNTTPAIGANFNSTVSQQVDLQFTQTVATGSCTLHQYALMSRNLPQ